jgi:hypothetical protein
MSRKCPQRSLPPFAQRTLRNIWPGSSGSLGLDVGGPDHLGPFLGFVDDQLAELGPRSRQRRAAEIGEARPHLGDGEGRIEPSAARGTNTSDFEACFGGSLAAVANAGSLKLLKNAATPFPFLEILLSGSHLEKSKQDLPPS